MATPARHREISAEFLDHAEVEFQKGDMLQASEKAWGAIAHYSKAVSEEQGWQHRSHFDLRKSTLRLIESADDPGQCLRYFWIMERLHINFYEEQFSAGEVRFSLDDTHRLMDALKVAESRL